MLEYHYAWIKRAKTKDAKTKSQIALKIKYLENRTSKRYTARRGRAASLNSVAKGAFTNDVILREEGFGKDDGGRGVLG